MRKHTVPGAHSVQFGDFHGNVKRVLPPSRAILGAVSSQSSVVRSGLTCIWAAVTLLVVAHWRYSPDAFGGYMAGLMDIFGLTISVLSLRMHEFPNDNLRFAKSLKQQASAILREKRICHTKDDTILEFADPAGVSPDPLTDILRKGARDMLAQAVEAEVGALLAKHAHLTDAASRQRLVRHV